ncbi:hypothetical protein PM082_022761 [Marasmius tenuissimus]|nr:hypothetical protein PM082_022761 [Marasmius tenuissimus]
MLASRTSDWENDDIEDLQAHSQEHMATAREGTRQNVRDTPDLSAISFKDLIEGAENSEAERFRKTIKRHASSTSALMLEHQATAYKSLLHPIQCLPPEILGRIIALAADVNLFSTERPEEARWESSKLSSVCSLWRNVALSTPEVWYRLAVDLPVYRHRYSALLEAIQLHIRRARRYPSLHLELVIARNPNSHPLSVYLNNDVVLRDIFLYSPRISHLGVTFSRVFRGVNMPIGHLLGHFLGNLPGSGSASGSNSRLTSLRLEESHHERRLPGNNLGLDLRYLSQSNFPTAPITTITLDPVNVSRTISVFHLLPNLTYVDVGLVPIAEVEPTAPPTMTVLSHLQYLTVRNICPDYLPNFLSSITELITLLDAPKLRDLTIARGIFKHTSIEQLPRPTHSTHFVDAFTTFISRSNPPLRIFSCPGLIIHTYDLERFLQAAPVGMRELNLADSPTHRVLHRSTLKLLELCNDDDISTNLFPNLRILKLSLIDDREWVAVMDIIRSRATSGLKWCRVRVKGTDAKRKEVLKIMEVALGLEIDLVPPAASG